MATLWADHAVVLVGKQSPCVHLLVAKRDDPPTSLPARILKLRAERLLALGDDLEPNTATTAVEHEASDHGATLRRNGGEVQLGLVVQDVRDVTPSPIASFAIGGSCPRPCRTLA